jgi:hypothetical protein
MLSRQGSNVVKELVGNNFPNGGNSKSGLFTPLFEKDDCMDATTKGWSMDRGTRPRKGEVDRVGNKRSRATQGGVAEGPGEIF